MRLDAHHWRGYGMLGREQQGDLMMLCRPCHQLVHGRGMRLKGKPWLWAMVWRVGVVVGVLEVVRWMVVQVIGS